MSDIFISYARPTAKQAQNVTEALRSLGYDVWIDDELPAHRSFSEVIDEQLLSAKAVVAIWSAEAVKSQWVRSEADAARKAGTLVQVSIDGALPPRPFDQIQCADLNGWAGDTNAPGWRKVVASIAELIGAAAPASLRVDAAGTAAKSSEPLLAVLAFDNISGDPELAYFSDGISEEILQTVAQGTNVKVIARSSSFQFRGADKAIRHVTAELKSTHVLDGSVRRSGTRVRISANLIECARQTTLWSDRFDRELSDVFALQDEIAAAVAEALRLAFAPPVQRETIDPAAYTLYLKALEIRNKGLERTTRLEVTKMLEQSTSLAPNFARAWAFLATMKAASLQFDEHAEADAGLRGKVIEAAETALRLDPGLGAAYQALGQLKPHAQFAEREELHRTALSVAPNDPTVLTSASLFFTEVGRIQEALGYAKRAFELDPMYPWAANWYVSMVDYGGRDDECAALYEKLCNLWPNNVLIMWNAIASAAAHGNWARSDKLIHAARVRKLDSPTLRRVIADVEFQRNVGPEIQSRCLESARSRLTRDGFLDLAEFAFLIRLGLINDVFELIDRTSFEYMFDPQKLSPNASASNGVIFSAIYNGGMMRDARFPRLCAKLGLCSYWIKTERWPDCASHGVLPYDFKAECRRQLSRGSQ